MNRHDPATSCPECGARKPTQWSGAEPWLCSVVCHLTFAGLRPPSSHHHDDHDDHDTVAELGPEAIEELGEEVTTNP